MGERSLAEREHGYFSGHLPERERLYDLLFESSVGSSTAGMLKAVMLAAAGWAMVDGA